MNNIGKYTPLGIPDPAGRYTVILADGQYPSSPYSRRILENAAKVVCCDGAADSYTAAGGLPAAIVGDLDSVSPATKVKFAPLLHHDSGQQTNDLTKAVVFCANILREDGDIIILGATGKREDHTVGNISLLADYNTIYGLCGRVRMVTELGVVDHIDRKTIFDGFAGQQVSILCLDPATRITTYGLKYPLYGAHLKAWWQGTLNESLGDSFGIDTDGHTFIYRLLP
ncbi:MAG: thiamine diphosphokinase [Rikenellaceae bacterium]|nr:thiamine diphosphokinase [Rikenellaceae bacterium]